MDTIRTGGFIISNLIVRGVKSRIVWILFFIVNAGLLVTFPSTVKANAVTVEAEALQGITYELDSTINGWSLSQIYSDDRLSVKEPHLNDVTSQNVKWRTFYLSNKEMEYMFSRDGKTVETKKITINRDYDFKQFPFDVRWITVSNFNGDLSYNSVSPITNQKYRYSTDGITIHESEQVPANAQWATLIYYETTYDGKPMTLSDRSDRKKYSIKFIPVGLQSLNVNHGTLSPAFSSNKEEYSMEVLYAVTSIDLTPVAKDSKAMKVEMNGSVVTSGDKSPIRLEVGSNPITFKVTNPHGLLGFEEKTYTINVTRAAASTNAELSGVSVTEGTLSPTFSSDTLSYTSEVLNSVDKIDVTPTVADSTATVKVDGKLITSGTATTIPLNVGENTITLTVTAEDEITTKSYIITVTRPPSTNANLSMIDMSTGTLSPIFSSEESSYTASVPNSVSSIDMTPTVADSTATVEVDGKPITNSTATTFPLNVGENMITITVIAEDKTTVKTYTITVTRQPSDNADLSTVTLNTGPLSPVFSSEEITYTASVSNTVTSIDVTSTVADSTATVEVDGKPIPSGDTTTIPLNVGENPITLTVTAEDKITVKSYTITVTRQPSDNADLTNIALNTGTLSPVFSSGVTTYKADVPNTVTSIDLIPTVADSTATVHVNGTSISNGDATTIPLIAGENAIIVTVTAQSGSTKSYTITVTRPPSSDANLSNIALNAGTLSPVFTSGVTSYTASVSNTINSIDITPTVADSTAKVQVNGTSISNGDATTLPLNVGENTIILTVTAEDKTTVKSYTITVSRQPSENADLTNIALNMGTLSPVFSSDVTTYTARVPYSLASIDLTATVAAATATVTINGKLVKTSDITTIPLKIGENKLIITVTAQSGSTKSYTITVTRQLPSDNADLSNVTLSKGTLSPVFSSGVTTYKADVPNSVTSIDLIPTVADSAATVTVNDIPITNGHSTTIPLAVGTNTITAVVLAEDGSTKTIYTMVVNRSWPPVQPPDPPVTVPDKPLIPEDAKEMTAQLNVDSKKVWKITLSADVIASSVTEDTIFVTDQNGYRIPTAVTFGERNEIILTPSQPYKAGQTYILYIDKGVQSASGKFLVTPYKMKFTISK